MMEFLGEVIMVLVWIGGFLVSVKVDKNYCVDIGDIVFIKVLMEYCYLFDVEIGECVGG